MRPNITDANGEIHNVERADEVQVLTLSTTFDQSDMGKEFQIGTDALVMTLPLIGGITGKIGDRITFRNIGADANNIITIAPDALNKIVGSLSAGTGGNADATTADGLLSKSAGALDKDFVNTKATANIGDWITLQSDGSLTWLIIGGIGVWASEA